MNKSELIKAIATKAGLPQKQAADALTVFQTIIVEALKAGENVQVTGFGTFEVRTRAAVKSNMVYKLCNHMVYTSAKRRGVRMRWREAEGRPEPHSHGALTGGHVSVHRGSSLMR